eukprot:873125_1
MHVATRKCDIEMIKLLLIYGGDITLCNFKIQNPNVESREMGQMGQWYTCTQFMAKYDTGATRFNRFNHKPYESVKDVYKILEESTGDDKVKAQIKKIFDTKTRWFPQMLHFYPNNKGKALEAIME